MMTNNKPQARSQFFQLAALGIAHPISEFHTLLLDNSYQRALAQASHNAFGHSSCFKNADKSFAELEAQYIDLFQVGKHGKPRVYLNAGDYDDLARDHSRPEFLLLYTGWYKHFGLQINDEPDSNELPDHLVCQLEFMAWLAHLETSAEGNPELSGGYQRAQLDFCKRHLQTFLEHLVAALQAHQHASHYFALAVLLLESVTSLIDEYDALLTDASIHSTDRVELVNLWE